MEESWLKSQVYFAQYLADISLEREENGGERERLRNCYFIIRLKIGLFSLQREKEERKAMMQGDAI